MSIICRFSSTTMKELKKMSTGGRQVVKKVQKLANVIYERPLHTSARDGNIISGVVIEFYLLILVEKCAYITFSYYTALEHSTFQFQIVQSVWSYIILFVESGVESIVIYRAVVGFSNPGGIIIDCPFAFLFSENPIKQLLANFFLFFSTMFLL